jgi:transposase-like protein
VIDDAERTGETSTASLKLLDWPVVTAIVTTQVDPSLLDEIVAANTLVRGDFVARFSDDAACLEYLWRTRFSPDGTSAVCPICREIRTFRRYDNKVQRRAWSCTTCGHYLHPTAGTIFHKSSTPLRLWFLAIYLITSEGRVRTIRELEHELGVTYKTAWRIYHLIIDQLQRSAEDLPSNALELLQEASDLAVS